jgi:tellurite resistance protein TerC
MKKHFRLWSDYPGNKFIAKKDGLIYITPLFITLALIEVSDLVFAVDSIPAVIAISRDPFIVVTSNIFAIL